MMKLRANEVRKYLAGAATLSLLLIGPIRAQHPVVLLSDDFRDLDTGLFSVSKGAHMEYHYAPEAEPRGQGQWSVAAFMGREGFEEAWHVSGRKGVRRSWRRPTKPDRFSGHGPCYWPVINSGLITR